MKLREQSKELRDRYFSNIISTFENSWFMKFSMKIFSSIITLFILNGITIYMKNNELVVILQFVISYYCLYCVSFSIFHNFDSSLKKIIYIFLRLYTFAFAIKEIIAISYKQNMFATTSLPMSISAKLLFIFGFITISFLVRVKNHVYNNLSKSFLYRLFNSIVPLLLFLLYTSIVKGAII